MQSEPVHYQLSVLIFRFVDPQINMTPDMLLSEKDQIPTARILADLLNHECIVMLLVTQHTYINTHTHTCMHSSLTNDYNVRKLELPGCLHTS